VVHNWIDALPYAQTVPTGEWRRRYGLNGKFVLLFAGVMGPSQGLDFVIEVADRVKANADIFFLFAGDGAEKPRLQEMAGRLGLGNVLFGPFVSKQEYPELLKDVDVGLVSLSGKNKTPVVPGKILGYMAAGIPVLAFLQRQSDAHGLISDAECGYSAVYGDFEKATNLIARMYEHRSESKRLGANGAKYVSEVFSLEKAVEKIEALFHKPPVAAAQSASVVRSNQVLPVRLEHKAC
jgi:glycosyltransferase involved in cell wall biosynthesis